MQENQHRAVNTCPTIFEKTIIGHILITLDLFEIKYARTDVVKIQGKDCLFGSRNVEKGKQKVKRNQDRMF